MILPTNFVPYTYSGQPYYKMKEHLPTALEAFMQAYGPNVLSVFGCSSYDTSPHRSEWFGVSPEVEIVSVDWCDVEDKYRLQIDARKPGRAQKSFVLAGL